MAKKYELWIDESGSFEDADAKLKKENPSLIGGILLEKEIANQVDVSELIPQERNHATEMRAEDKAKYLIPTLEKAKEMYQARLFYIENPNYETGRTNRDLYLRMMAEGLLQLMQVLNAESESVELDVVIAQRQDWRAKPGQKRINENEYLYRLKSCIDNKRKRNGILLHENSTLKFDIDSAYTNPKLELADYACYTRFRRKSTIFKACRDRLNRLFEDAYLFTVTEVGTVSRINRLLSNNMVADAIYEVFTTIERISHARELAKISERMKATSYRLVKSQLKQFAADITSYVANEDDYEIGEKLLKSINEELIPLLKETGMPYETCQFIVLIQLIDMYLREGDICAARRTLEECRKVQETFGNSLENIFSYYQMIEKEAVLLIDEFRYEEAATLMGKVCSSFEKMMDVIVCDENLKIRFPDIKSEYFGDALCMKIYAEMFLQRLEPQRYQQLCEESNLALKQYPGVEGELERHRQYRSHIELEAGNYPQALQWLMKAKMYEELPTDMMNIRDFFYELTTTEYEVSCQYYVMYYLLIMAETGRAGNPLANVMYEAIMEQEELLRIAGLVLKKDNVRDKFEPVDLREAKRSASGIHYHPKEINCWKMASYLYYNQRYREALDYYKQAYRFCVRFSNYDTMKITGVGIMAEKICCELACGNGQEASDDYKNLLQFIELLLDEDFPKETKEFILKVRVQLETGNDNGELNQEAIYQASRMITY